MLSTHLSKIIEDRSNYDKERHKRKVEKHLMKTFILTKNI